MKTYTFLYIKIVDIFLIKVYNIVIRGDIMKFCTKCGNKLNEDVKYCPKCGNPTEMEIEKLKIERNQKKEEKNLGLKILLNYSILLICVVGLIGASLVFLLPVAQICISIFNYNFSKKWQTVLMLEVNLWISTILGLFFSRYLFLKYIVDDELSSAIFLEILKIGAIFVFIMAIVTTLIKYISIKSNNKNQKINQ